VTIVCSSSPGGSRGPPHERQAYRVPMPLTHIRLMRRPEKNAALDRGLRNLPFLKELLETPGPPSLGLRVTSCQVERRKINDKARHQLEFGDCGCRGHALFACLRLMVFSLAISMLGICALFGVWILSDVDWNLDFAPLDCGSLLPLFPGQADCSQAKRKQACALQRRHR
jgi:hypothetical protein